MLINEETEAAASIRTKSGAINAVVELMSKMSKEQSLNFFSEVQAQIGHEADSIPSDAADKNRASVAMKGAVHEDVSAIFEASNLSEDTKTKISTLFEVAVNNQVQLQSQNLAEEALEIIDERVSEIEEQLIDQVNSYLEYVVETWIADNQVAVDSSLKAEISEEFMKNLRNLFAEHYIEIPEDKVDVVKEMAGRVSKLESKLDESINRNIGLISELELYHRNDMINDVTKGLTVSQTEKFKSLAEGLEYDGNTETYKNKLSVIREQYFTGKKLPTSIINESVSIDDESDENVPTVVEGPMKHYHSAISKTLKK